MDCQRPKGYKFVEETAPLKDALGTEDVCVSMFGFDARKSCCLAFCECARKADRSAHTMLPCRECTCVRDSSRSVPYVQYLLIAQSAGCPKQFVMLHADVPDEILALPPKSQAQWLRVCSRCVSRFRTWKRKHSSKKRKEDSASKKMPPSSPVKPLVRPTPVRPSQTESGWIRHVRPPPISWSPTILNVWDAYGKFVGYASIPVNCPSSIVLHAPDQCTKPTEGSLSSSGAPPYGFPPPLDRLPPPATLLYPTHAPQM
eukprot:TRINITY_DN1519_c0_g1_i1.p2 TRINITY_DN1519_c0_g1~~TRINITY_DN1519_c0_g1_i1.p2  ORF type:complete len:258 (-),score=47.66 TRINITY_DN1519_c0_g1_i1:263-1036(-)